MLILKTFMDAIPNPIYSKDEQGVYNHCNIAFTEFLGRKTEELIGNTDYYVFEKKLAETYNKSDKNLMEKKERWNGTIHVLGWDTRHDGFIRIRRNDY